MLRSFFLEELYQCHHDRDLFDTHIYHPKDSMGQGRHISPQVHEAVEISTLFLGSLSSDHTKTQNISQILFTHLKRFTACVVQIRAIVEVNRFSCLVRDGRLSFAE